MKKGLKILLLLLLVIIVGSAVYVYFAYFYNYEKVYETYQQIEVEKSKYHISGSWWGYNQKKLATIGDVTFSFFYDNSNLDYGNSSENNPFKCHFTIIKDGVSQIFDFGKANASCNVLADPILNKVYYIVNEPVGEANNGGYAWNGPGKIVFYIYDYHPIDKIVSFNSKYTLSEALDDGRQRMGTAINDKGQIIVSYGSYDAMLNVFIYDPINNSWNTYQTLSNPDNDFLMYNYALIKDLDEFYVLVIQDTAKNNSSYYQYVKFFAYQNGSWSEKMIMDYRDNPLAQTEPNLIEHTEFTVIEDQIHIITRSNVLKEIHYFIWANNDLVEQDISFIPNKAIWIRLLSVDNDLLFIYNYESRLEIYSDNKNKIVYRNRKFIEKAYVYVHLKANDTIQVLGICGSEKMYEKSKAYLYEIKKVI